MKRGRSSSPSDYLTQKRPNMDIDNTDDSRNGLALVSRRYDFKYVKLGNVAAPSLGKRKEFVTRYSKLEYVMMGEATASDAGAPASIARTAWGQYKNHQLPTGAGIYNVNTIGAVPLVNQDSSAGGMTRLPGLLLSLTRTPNLLNSAGTVTDSRINLMYPFIDGTGFTWKNISTTLTDATKDGLGLNTAGNYNEYPQNVYVNTRSGVGGDIYPGRMAILKNVNVKLELWGQKKRPTKFHIILCQLDQDNNPVMPSDATSISGRSVQFGPTSNGAKFWINEFKPYTHHPWAATYTAQNTRMKVLFSDTVYVEAKSNEDQDDAPQCRMKNYTFALNRRCHFDWDQQASNIDEADPNRWNREQFDANCRADVDPNARIYLFIKAENFAVQTPAVNSTSTDDKIPSVSMKTTWTWEMPT